MKKLNLFFHRRILDFSTIKSEGRENFFIDAFDYLNSHNKNKIKCYSFFRKKIIYNISYKKFLKETLEVFLPLPNKKSKL